MGATVNLIEAWETYKAAKSALSNILQNQNIKQIAQKYLNSLKVFFDLIEAWVISSLIISEVIENWKYFQVLYFFRFPIHLFQNYKKKVPLQKRRFSITL